MHILIWLSFGFIGAIFMMLLVLYWLKKNITYNDLYVLVVFVFLGPYTFGITAIMFALFLIDCCLDFLKKFSNDKVIIYSPKNRKKEKQNDATDTNTNS